MCECCFFFQKKKQIYIHICLFCSGDCEEIDYVITLLVDTDCLGAESYTSLEDCVIPTEDRIAVGTLDINFCDILPSEGLVGKFPQVLYAKKMYKVLVAFFC